MSEALTALDASVDRLRTVVEGLGQDQLRRPAYPSEWTVADVLSHLGSGAEIMRRGFEDTLAGRDTPAEFNQSVWDRWNAAPPDRQAADALAADAALLASLEGTPAERRQEFRRALGPVTLDFDAFVGMRLNEHVLHAWDIEVVLDPTATLPAHAVPVVIDNLALIAGFAGRPPGTDTTVSVRTTAPDRGLDVAMTPDSVRLTASPSGSEPSLTLPAESFVRLVYGRLDPDHTPAGVGGPDLDLLRRVFPGV